MDYSSARTRHDRSCPELVAGPRLYPSHAEGPPRSICCCLIVKLPFQSATLASAVGTGHCPTVSADPNRRQRKSDDEDRAHHELSGQTCQSDLHLLPKATPQRSAPHLTTAARLSAEIPT